MENKWLRFEKARKLSGSTGSCGDDKNVKNHVDHSTTAKGQTSELK